MSLSDTINSLSKAFTRHENVLITDMNNNSSNYYIATAADIVNFNKTT